MASKLASMAQVVAGGLAVAGDGGRLGEMVKGCCARMAKTLMPSSW
jgi:hypothetical protein